MGRLGRLADGSLGSFPPTTAKSCRDETATYFSMRPLGILLSRQIPSISREVTYGPRCRPTSGGVPPCPLNPAVALRSRLGGRAGVQVPRSQIRRRALREGARADRSRLPQGSEPGAAG